VTKKVIRKFGWINRNSLVKKVVQKYMSPAFAIEMYSDEFSLKHALRSMISKTRRGG